MRAVIDSNILIYYLNAALNEGRALVEQAQREGAVYGTRTHGSVGRRRLQPPLTRWLYAFVRPSRLKIYPRLTTSTSIFPFTGCSAERNWSIASKVVAWK